jgi:tetraacyldisaccharide 4'-kinase
MRLKTPSFWYRRPGAAAPVLEYALTPLSWIYAAGHAVNQNFSQSQKAAMPVICVGNLVAGGSGKTPAAIALMELVREKKIARNPYFLTRGYGGAERGPAVVDYFKNTAEHVGDESLLLARSAYTIVAADRVAGANFAKEKSSDLLILDDGLQNGSLHKDISFVVIDGAVGFGNGRLLPAGPLREPLDAGIARADAFILTGKDKAGVNEILPADKPVFTASVQVPESLRPDPTRRYIAFAGLGRPEKFYHLLQSLDLNIAGWHAFPDHYQYTPEDMQKLAQEAKEKDATLITTEKDHKRLPTGRTEAEVTQLPIRLEWHEVDALAAFLSEKLAARTS